MLAAAVGNPEVVIAEQDDMSDLVRAVTGVERLTDVRTHSARRLLRDSKCQLDQALRTLVSGPADSVATARASSRCAI